MSDQLEMQNIKARHKFATLMVSALCHNERDWIMSVPARPTYDPDIVISDSLKDVPKLIAEVERLRYENDNFAHENHSLTGDVAAVVERRAVGQKQIKSLQSQLEAAIEQRNELQERLLSGGKYHMKVRAEMLEVKGKLEAENAELKEENAFRRSEKDDVVKQNKILIGELTASEKRVEELECQIKAGEHNPLRNFDDQDHLGGGPY